MSIKWMMKVWDSAAVDGSELLVMLALADWSDDGGRCWYSVKKIAQRARVSERQVQKLLRSLEDKGLLKSEERYRDNGSHTSNIYQLFLDDTPGVVDDTTPGVVDDTRVVSWRTPPEPSLEPSDRTIKNTTIFSLRDAEKAISKVTGFAALPSGWVEQTEIVLSLLQRYGWDETINRLTSAKNDWVSQKRKDNGRNYSVLNPTWVNSAIVGESVSDDPRREIEAMLKRNQ